MSGKYTDPQKSRIIKEIFSYAGKFIPYLLIGVILPTVVIIVVPAFYSKFGLEVNDYLGGYFSAITLILTALGIIIAALGVILVTAIALFTLFFIGQSKEIKEQSEEIEKQSERLAKLEKTKEGKEREDKKEDI